MVPDVAEGYINTPREYLVAHAINPGDVGSTSFLEWVRDRVDLARLYFREGKRYLGELEVLPCKIASYWYCAILKASWIPLSAMAMATSCEILTPKGAS